MKNQKIMYTSVKQLHHDFYNSVVVPLSQGFLINLMYRSKPIGVIKPFKKELEKIDEVKSFINKNSGLIKVSNTKDLTPNLLNNLLDSQYETT